MAAGGVYMCVGGGVGGGIWWQGCWRDVCVCLCVLVRMIALPVCMIYKYNKVVLM